MREAALDLICTYISGCVARRSSPPAVFPVYGRMLMCRAFES